MGFGDFMKGMQGGMSTMQDFRRQRQLDELYDQAITEGRDKMAGRDHSLRKRGLPLLDRKKTSDTLLGRAVDKLDPFIARWVAKLGRGSGVNESPVADTLAAPGETGVEAPVVQDTSWEDQFEEFSFADGQTPWSKMTEAERTKYLAEQNRTRGGLPQDRVTGDPSQYKPAREGQVGNAPKNPPKQAIPTEPAPAGPKPGIVAGARSAAGKLARGAGIGTILATGIAGGRGFNRGYNAGDKEQWAADEDALRALVNEAIDAGGPENLSPEKQKELQWRRSKWEMRQRMDTMEDPNGFSGYMGDEFRSRAGRALKEAGREVVDMFTGAIPDVERKPAEAPAGTSPAAAPGPAGGPPRRTNGAPAPAIPTEAPQDPLTGFDASQYAAEDIPNFSATDWRSHREGLIDDYVANGMSYADAYDKVDQQVIQQQMRGFNHFGGQALALLAAGDKRGAAAALRAAFQYMPTTTDMNVVEYNGHLVGFFVDEDTGEQVGEPQVITAERLEPLLRQFSNPKTWGDLAQDRQIDVNERNAATAERNASTNEQYYGALGRIKELGALGGGGMKISDQNTVLEAAQNAVGQYVTEELADAYPGIEEAALYSFQLAVENGTPLPQATAQLGELLARPDGPEILMRIMKKATSKAG